MSMLLFRFFLFFSSCIALSSSVDPELALRINYSIKATKEVLQRIYRLSQRHAPESNFSPPTHITSDYIEIIFLTITFVVGCGLNAAVLFRVTRQYIHNTVCLHLKDVKTGHLLFKIHLTVTNLLVLMSYCPLKIAWLVMYEWQFGDLGCRFINFAWMAAFCLASNMVTSIAIDRAIIFRRLINAQENGGYGLLIGGNSYMRVVHWLTVGSYVLAVVCSVPQLLLWRQYLFKSDGGAWSQCVSEWQLGDACVQLGCSFKPSLVTSMVSRTTYAIYHTLILFWLPFVVIVFCYGIIVTRLARHSCRNKAPPTQMTGETMELSSSINCIDGEMCERRVPPWRRQMRSNIFRTAAAIVLCYLICWLPYNVVTLAAELNRDLGAQLADADFLKWFILINAVTNPLLYGFQGDDN